jgi:hypothetical protein
MLPRPTAPHLALALALVLLLPTGCKNPPEPTRETKPVPSAPVTGATPTFTSQTLQAAGIEIDVPSEWQVLSETDPGFALAFDATHKQPSACWIERRRQGLGPLPSELRAIDEGPQRRGYMRGVVRGIVQETPAADGSMRVIHCRARRSDTKLWSTVIEPVLASQREADPVAAKPVTRAGQQAIVELCSAGPIVPGYVCALQAGGAVYCGPTNGALDRVVTAPAVDLGCRGAIACARGSTGEVACWSAGQPAQPQPSFGKARSLTDACVVDERGDVQCVEGRELIATPLRAFDDASRPITGARFLMPGSSIEQGCVITDGGVTCWDERGDLPVRFHNPPIASDEATGRHQQAPESIDGRTDITELRRIGDRLCARAQTGAWRCTEASGAAHELAGCATEPCGCSLLGGNQMACEDQTEPRIDALPQGRIAEVVSLAEPCAALVDGGVVCRTSGSLEMRRLELRESTKPVELQQ